MRITRATTTRKGAAAVEFAVVAPLLFMLFFGMVEFGRAMMVLNVVTNSARAGARAGAVTSGGYTSIETAVDNALAKGALPTGTRTIIVQVDGTTVTSATFAGAATAGKSISVQVSVPYSDVSWMPNGGFFLGAANMVETAVMRREG